MPKIFLLILFAVLPLILISTPLQAQYLKSHEYIQLDSTIPAKIFQKSAQSTNSESEVQEDKNTVTNEEFGYIAEYYYFVTETKPPCIIQFVNVEENKMTLMKIWDKAPQYATEKMCNLLYDVFKKQIIIKVVTTSKEGSPYIMGVNVNKKDIAIE